MGKIYEDQKMAKEWDYVSLKSLRRKEEPLFGEIPKKNKGGMKEVIETMIVLSALAEEYRRPHLKPTFEVAPNPWDTENTTPTLPITFCKVEHKHIRFFPKGNRAVQFHF